MHTLRLKLRPTKYQKYVLNYIFSLYFRIYVLIVKYAQKQIRLLNRDKEYKRLKHLYKILKEQENVLNREKSKLSDKDCKIKNKKKQISIINKKLKSIKKDLNKIKSEFNNLYCKYNLTKSEFESATKCFRYKYSDVIYSTWSQKLSDFVYVGIEKYLYGNGKTLHIKKFNEVNLISQKEFNKGFHYDNNKMIVLGEEIEIIFKGTSYEKESLSHKINYIELKKIEFNNTTEFYINFVLEDAAPKKVTPGVGEVGTDPGVSSVASHTDKSCKLEELAPRCKDYNKQIAKLQRRLDQSLRSLNPDLYNEDGTVKKGSKGKFKYSKNTKYLQRKIRVLYRKKKAYTLCSHNNYLNRLLQEGNVFKVEKMNWQSLAKRSKDTGREEKVSIIKGKRVKKHKKRKRFGKSVTDRSPGLLIKRMEEKCNQYDLEFIEVDTFKTKASKFNHKTGKFEEHKLSERTKTIGKNLVQRDLYSAFLIKNTYDDKIDSKKCNKDFKRFLVLQEEEFKRIKKQKIKNKNFGI